MVQVSVLLVEIPVTWLAAVPVLAAFTILFAIVLLPIVLLRIETLPLEATIPKTLVLLNNALSFAFIPPIEFPTIAKFNQIWRHRLAGILRV